MCMCMCVHVCMCVCIHLCIFCLCIYGHPDSAMYIGVVLCTVVMCGLSRVYPQYCGYKPWPFPGRECGCDRIRHI